MFVCFDSFEALKKEIDSILYSHFGGSETLWGTQYIAQNSQYCNFVIPRLFYCNDVIPRLLDP